MEYGQLPLPAKESGRFALVPGELGELLKSTSLRQKIQQVRHGARNTGQTFKTLSPRRGIRQPRFGT